ncbi:transposase [Nonomuraea zeae]|uniref:Transposase n=1 Tax=Nonomuraea zeae TaxID=1642303 RepID=A0A5S4GEZ1_9ACTN|nr:transposase [Nonomuraea zeae]TMR31543.1 transposase [Nonomuraea zeae]
MRPGDLTNAEWKRLAPLLPTGDPHEDLRDDHRTVINGVLHQARTGSRWRHLPPRYGCWVSVYKRHRRWTADGTWQRLLTAIRTADDTAPDPTSASPDIPPPVWHKDGTAGDPVLAILRAHLAQTSGQPSSRQPTGGQPTSGQQSSRQPGSRRQTGEQQTGG